MFWKYTDINLSSIYYPEHFLRVFPNPLLRLPYNTGVMRSYPDFEEAWKEYYPKLFVYLQNSFGIRQGEDLEDMVQDILLKACSRRKRFDPRYSFATWLYTLARNHCIDRLRKKGPVYVGVDPESLQTDADPVSSGFLAAESCEAVCRTLTGLSADERSMVFLRYYEDLSCRDIARVMGLPEGTVKSRFHTIRGKLEVELKEMAEL